MGVSMRYLLLSRGGNGCIYEVPVSVPGEVMGVSMRYLLLSPRGNGCIYEVPASVPER